MGYYHFAKELLTESSLHLGVCKSTENREFTNHFLMKQNKVLSDFHCEKILSADKQFVLDNDVYLIYLINKENDIVAGGRVIIKHPNIDLPIECIAKEYMPDKSILLMREIASYSREHGIAESGGLWADKAFRGMNYGLFFALSEIAIGYSLPLDRLIALISPHMPVEAILNLGCKVETAYGDNGKLAYPTKDYLSTFIRWDKCDFQNASKDVSDTILLLSDIITTELTH